MAAVPTRRLSCKQLMIGMKIVELDRPWAQSPFTVHGFTITSSEEITKLQACCDYVYAALKTAPLVDSQDTNLARQSYSNTHSFSQAMPQAKSAHRQAKSVVTGFYKSLRLGQSFDSNTAKKAIKQCVSSILANQEAMLWLGLLKDVDEYTARHSLNVGLLSIILGRAEGLSVPDLEMVGMCGMLHDMGKANIPLEILNKEGAFDDDEFAIMKTHTTLGYQILQKKHDIDAEVANVAYSHHERLNGRGYPRALPADQITYFSRIVAIADTYDAITSQRVYSPAKTSLEGLKILMGAKGSHFDAGLVERFVGCIGIYPVGSVAELSNGEIAIVLPSPPQFCNTPRVLVVRDKDKQPCHQKTIDLSEAATIEGQAAKIKIKHLISDNSFGIDIRHYHQLGGEAG